MFERMDGLPAVMYERHAAEILLFGLLHEIDVLIATMSNRDIPPEMWLRVVAFADLPNIQSPLTAT